MPHEHPRVSALVLAREEIRALPRQTFALAAVTLILAFFAPLAAFGLEGPDAFQDHLIFLWLVAELAVAIIVAARIAAARRSRFVDSLYTTPLEARTWLSAQLIVGVFLASLVLLAQAPFILVHFALVGPPPFVGQMLMAAIGVAACAVALGAFCGVIVGDSGPGAAAGLAGGFGFLSFILLLLHGIAGPGPFSPGELFLMRISALSPLTLVVDAVGIDIFGTATVAPWRALVGLAALVLGLGGAAWLAYTRAQGPLGWEPRGYRAPIVALVALALVVPIASASVEYREVEEERTFHLVHGEHTRLAFLPRGEPVNDETFSTYSYWSWAELDHGKDNDVDMLVLLLVPEGKAASRVTIQLTGSDTMQVVSGGRHVIADGKPSGHEKIGGSFGQDPDPDAPLKPYYRVPVTLRPLEAQAMLDSRGLVEVVTTFVVDGSAQESRAKVTLESDIPGATPALLFAGTPLPLAALAALVTRRIQTR